jgi:hypothetical protein
MENDREMSAGQASGGEYRAQEPATDPKARPPRSGYARLKRRQAAVCEMLDRAREDNDGLLRAYAELEENFRQLRELHERLLADIRRTTQRQPARRPFTASIFGTDFNVR